MVDSGDPVYIRYDEVLDRAVEFSGAAPGRKVLDIGTGTGKPAERLVARGAKVIGVDPSLRRLDPSYSSTVSGPGEGQAPAPEGSRRLRERHCPGGCPSAP